MNTKDTVNKLLSKNSGVIRTVDAVRAGIYRTSLGLLVKNGQLERIARGQYIRPNDMPDELYALQLRSKKIIFSHETALFLHNLAERTPFQHTLTIPSTDKLSPAISNDCKVYYVKPQLHGLGKCRIMSKMGNEVIAYNAERTICDVLRSRNRIDGQVFAAAMRNYVTSNKQDWNKLRDYAEIFSVTKLLRQYLEVLL